MESIESKRKKKSEVGRLSRANPIGKVSIGEGKIIQNPNNAIRKSVLEVNHILAVIPFVYERHELVQIITFLI